jgi:TolB-like protein/class 3 adenylate cyclase
VNDSSDDRRLSAILAADVVGYTRLMEQDTEGTVASWKSARSEIIDPAISRHAGRLVKHTGDGFLAEFQTVLDSVECAIAIQNGLVSNPLEFRMGINLGDIIDDGEDIHGEGVNIAARIEGLAENGGICISGSVYDQVRNRLDIAWEDMGDHEVKHVTAPVRVYRIAAEKPDTATVMSSEIPTADKPSIAVLPFDNMSNDPEQEYFADGMAEDLITALSKFRSFFVIARNSTFCYKGTAIDLTALAKELSARYIVEGSVRKSGNRLRITAQLIDGTNGNHIWAERYDRALEDIFDVQDEITETIVGTIAPEIGAFERKNAARRQPDNLDAWGLFQRGLSVMWRWDQAGLEGSIELFRKALEKDPALSQIHTYLGFAILHLSYLGIHNDDLELVAEAARHTREALRQDDTDSLAHAMLARMLSHEKRIDEAIEEARQAVHLNPNLAIAHQTLGVMYIWANRCAEGWPSFVRALALSPNDPFRTVMLAGKAVILGETGKPEEAVDVLKEACRLPHRDYRAWLFLAVYATEIGDENLARDAAAKVLEFFPGFTGVTFRQKMAPMHPDLHDSMEINYVKAGLPAA